MSRPTSRISAISFWDWETTTAMSVASMNAICSSSRPLELRQRVGALAELVEVELPLLGDEVVHAHGGGLVDRDEHRLAEEAAADEVAHEIGGDPPQPLGPGDELVLGREAPRERPLLRLVELGLFEDLGELLVEGLVDDLQLGDAVLVVERDGRAVVDRVAEVVGRDVVAEDLARALLLARSAACR